MSSLNSSDIAFAPKKSDDPKVVEPAVELPPDEVSEVSAAISDCEPETTATAARTKSMSFSQPKAKRSYKTVDPLKRRQLIQMVQQEQKTIKEAANRLKINYSTAKHIIKSKKNEAASEAPKAPASPKRPPEVQLPLKAAPPCSVEALEREVRPPRTLSADSLRGEPTKTFNSSLLYTSLSLGQLLCPGIHCPN